MFYNCNIVMYLCRRTILQHQLLPAAISIGDRCLALARGQEKPFPVWATVLRAQPATPRIALFGTMQHCLKTQTRGVAVGHARTLVANAHAAGRSVAARPGQAGRRSSSSRNVAAHGTAVEKAGTGKVKVGGTSTTTTKRSAPSSPIFLAGK